MPIYELGRGQLAGVLYKIFGEVTQDNDIRLTLEDRRAVTMTRAFGQLLLRKQIEISSHLSKNSSSSLFIEEEDRLECMPCLRAEVYSPGLDEVYIKPYMDVRVWMPKSFGGEELIRTSMGVRIPIDSIGNLMCCVSETN